YTIAFGKDAQLLLASLLRHLNGL
ncbi:hypothetical protein D030_1257, partial [Vibrio parahaemolyticus AQ3810]